MKTVLVTGAGGFIGRHAVAALRARGYEVHAVGRHRPEGVVWHEADLLAPGAAHAVAREVAASHLLHLAWNARPGAFWTAPDNTDWVAASLGLYRGFAEAGGRRFVGAGTCAEYDWSAPILDEATTPCCPATLYGAAKDALRRVLQAAATQDGIGFAWGRVFFVYGPHEAPPRLVPSVVVPLLEGREAACGPGLAARDFMHAEDVAGALVHLLDSEAVGPVNIASGACVPLRDVILALAEAIGRPDLVRLGARPAVDEPARLEASVARLRALGFTPRHTLQAGLAETVQWWRAHFAETVAFHD
jgi:nucleoside-diphosphate-sugar epimerase